MINFRYHIVSLTAVFLALAIGLVVGTAALNGPVADNLSHQVTQISRTNTQLRDQVDNLEKEIGQKEQFATEAAPMLLNGTLTGRRVLVVSMQKSSKYVPDVLTDLALAGAKVTGQVEIEDSFVQPGNSGQLLDTAETSISSTSISGLPTNSDGVETSSALLAAVLMDHSPTVPDQVRTTVLGAYQGLNYITVTGGADAVKTPAEAVIMIAGPPYVDQSAAAENASMVTIIDQLDKAGPIVVGAAAAAGSGNVVGAVTGDAALTKTVSTVDNIDTPQGQIAAVLALNEQIVTGTAGHYGLGVQRLVTVAEDATVTIRRIIVGAGCVGLGALAARGALAAVRSAPRSDRLDRTNFHGRSVSLAGGPALAAAATVTAALGAGSPAVAAAALLAGGGSGAVGFYDDIVGARPEQKAAKGFRGHLSALRDGRVTSGLVKIAGVGAAAFGAALLVEADEHTGGRRRGAASRFVNVVLGTGVIAGSANLLNLLDLRPGRALKAGVLLSVPLLADSPAGAALMAGPVGAAAALLPADLDEEIMLGDAGANAYGALLGLAAVTRTGMLGRAGLLAGIAALTATSERVSFTKVIESTPGLRELDALGRRSDHVATRASERPRFLG